MQLLLLLAASAAALQPAMPTYRRRHSAKRVVMMGRKFENNKVKMAKTAAANAKKSSYIGKKIKVAVKAGGPDPDANRALGLIIKEAQALNVKRDIVDRNIKAASSDKDGADFKELTYELYGHGGVGFVINALSDNSNRAYTDVGTVAKKANLKLAESGSVLHNFEKKGRLAVNSALDEDDLIELALENDVDDVEAGEPDPEDGRAIVLSAIFATCWPVAKALHPDLAANAALPPLANHADLQAADPLGHSRSDA